MQPTLELSKDHVLGALKPPLFVISLRILWHIFRSNGVDEILFIEGPGGTEVHVNWFDNFCFVIPLSLLE